MARKSGVKVDELYVTVGADISELDADFALADKTVKQAMAQLNRQNTKVKLQAEIDLSKATTDTEKFNIKQRQLQEQMRISAERVKILNVEYQNMVKDTGAASASSQSLENSLLRQKKAYAELGAEMRKLSADRRAAESGPMPTASKAPSISGGGSLESVAGGYAIGSMGAKVAGAAAIAYTAYETAKQGIGYGMDAVDQNVKVGNAIYMLGQRYHITTDEAAKMSLAFKLTGTDANDAIPALTRLDRQLLTAGANGNTTTQALQKFGVQLESSPGRLVPMNEQLRRLSEGYQRANEQGMAQEYVAEVLGQKGLALLPILSELGDVQDRLANIKTTGLLDPEMSRRVMKQEKELNFELMQLKMSVGAALMPVAEDLLPKLIKGSADLVESISKNKDAIKDVANAFIAAGGVIIGVLKMVASMLDAVGINIDNIAGGLNRIRYMNGGSQSAAQNIGNGAIGVSGGIAGMKAGAMLGTAIAGPAGTVIGGGIGAIGGYIAADVAYSKLFPNASGYNAAQAQKIGSHNTMTDAEASARANAQGTSKAIAELKRRQQEQKQIDDAQKAAEEQKAAEIEQINADLTDKLASLRRNQLENNLAAIDKEMQAYRDKGASEELIEQVTAERKAKIREDFETNVVAKIDSVWKSSLQNRLDDIDRERKAYIQKGVDEVKAAQWTEHEKRMAAVNEARQAFKERREMLDAMRVAMSGSGTQEQKMNNARVAMLDIYRKQNGITDDMRTSPEEMQLFSGLYKDVENNAWPGLEGDAWARNMAANQIEIIRGNQRSAVNPAMLSMGGGGFIPIDRGTQQSYASQSGAEINIHNEFHDNVIEDDVLKTKLVNEMAGRTTEVIRGVTRSGWNKY